MTDHSLTIPEAIWKWAQQKSEKTNPASLLRETLWMAMVTERQHDALEFGMAIGNGGKEPDKLSIIHGE